MPKLLVKKDPQKSFGFVSKATGKDGIHKIIQLARENTSVSVLWILRVSSAKLEPSGLAVVTNKQMLLLGSGELCLE